MLDRIHDTIVAVSSPSGRGAVGIVRLDGPEALAVAETFCLPADQPRKFNRIGDVPASSRIEGRVVLDSDLPVPAVFYVFKAPRSYTRHHLIEIHTIGSFALLNLVVARAIQAGARQAEPGEFTARAFLNGAMDLSEAEAVAGVIQAGSDRALSAARRVRSGLLGRRVSSVAEALTELLALVEADIDFADEPIEFISPQEISHRLGKLDAMLAELAGTALCAERVSPLPRVLLIGRPNAGKSALMNALTGLPRSLCSPLPGTTRDVLSAPVHFGDLEALLLDSAGMDENDAPADPVAAAAKDATLAEAVHADVLLLVCDARLAPDFEMWRTVRDAAKSPVVVVLNKVDLLDHMSQCAVDQQWRAALRSWLEHEPEGSIRDEVPIRWISALHGHGLDELRATVATTLGDPPPDRGTPVGPEAARQNLAVSPDATAGWATLLMTRRQLDAIAEARDAIGRAAGLTRSLRQTSDGAELLAFELREALNAIGAITGTVAPDDLLGRIFANFCIGK